MEVQEGFTMSDRDMPEELLQLILSELPPLPAPAAHGGRPAIAHEVVLQVLWFALKTGTPWRMIPKAMGCSGETVRTRILVWAQRQVWKRIHRLILQALQAAGALDLETVVVDSTLVRAHGGGADSGPNPTDRRKPGTKFTLIVDGQGVPLELRTAPANRSDQRELIPVVAALRPIPGRRGRPRTKPQRLYADAGYDSAAARSLLKWLGIKPFIRKRNSPHGSHLGKIRYVVERTIAWLKGVRRLRFRYDRSAAMLQSIKHIALIFVGFRILNHHKTTS
jgi:transposase